MFTGIIESAAIVADVIKEGTNTHFILSCPLTPELREDQSVAHNGVCLTIEELYGDKYKVTAVAETIAKTTLGSWVPGDRINIERSLKIGDRLDGHFVQGHVDTTAACIDKQELQGSSLFRFRFPRQFAALVIEKGSVCINGVSLTVFDVGNDEFTVTIIPYTFEHTNFGTLAAGEPVNVEFDVLGKYLLRNLSLNT